MENLNRVLLENVLPAHVAEHFLGRNWKNEVSSNVVFGVFFFFFFSCLCRLLTLRRPLSLLPEQTLHSCSSSVILSSAAGPLVALPPHISSILTSVSLSESNYFFPAAVTPLSGMIKLSSYVFLDSVSPLGS